jgi:hypothetical protein
MPEEYASPQPVSTFKWRLTLALAAGTLMTVVVMVIVLALGAADPPRGAELLWRTSSADDWQMGDGWDDFQLFDAPLPLSAPPFTLELTAANSGTPDSAWGISIQTLEGRWTAVISREGYVSLTTSPQPSWAEFLHIQRSGENKLYLHVEANGQATLRINDEVAWESHLSVSEGAIWSLAQYRQPKLDWNLIAVYH